MASHRAVLVGVERSCGHCDHVEGIATLLRKTAGYRKREDIVCLLAEEATSGNIQLALAEGCSDGTLFVYLAGHGGRSAVLSAYDRDLPYADILASARLSGAMRIIVFVEACHSGTFTRLLDGDGVGNVTIIVGPTHGYSSYYGIPTFPSGIGASCFLQVALDGFLVGQAEELTCGAVVDFINAQTSAWTGLRPDLDIYPYTLVGGRAVVLARR